MHQPKGREGGNCTGGKVHISQLGLPPASTTTLKTRFLGNLMSKMEASVFSVFLLLLCQVLFSSQTVAQKDGPTIGFISPDVVSDIGKQN